MCLTFSPSISVLPRHHDLAVDIIICNASETVSLGMGERFTLAFCEYCLVEEVRSILSFHQISIKSICSQSHEYHICCTWCWVELNACYYSADAHQSTLSLDSAEQA
jgi:hypothetical protein